MIITRVSLPPKRKSASKHTHQFREAYTPPQRESIYRTSATPHTAGPIYQISSPPRPSFFPGGKNLRPPLKNSCRRVAVKQRLSLPYSPPLSFPPPLPRLIARRRRRRFPGTVPVLPTLLFSPRRIQRTHRPQGNGTGFNNFACKLSIF